jgi:uncharacterized protein YhbP (UPF0306 family)
VSGVRLAPIVFEDVRGARASVPGASEASLLGTVLRVLEGNELCSIATSADGHRPYISTAYFCYSKELALYFLSHPNARHCRNLARHPSAAVAVCSSGQPWGLPNLGVQLFGECRRANGPRRREAERLYAARFPAYPRWRSTLAAGQAGSEYRFYRVLVTSLKIMDEQAIGDGVFARAMVRRAGRRAVVRGAARGRRARRRAT